MLLDIARQLLKIERKVPAEFARLIRTEYRSVPQGYVDHFYKTTGRLPAHEELIHAAN